MPIPAGATRISIRGHLGTTEVFTTSFWVNRSGGTGTAQELADALVANASLIAFRLNMTGNMNPSDGVDELLVYEYDGGTAVADQGRAAFTYAGYGQAAPMPKSTCCVLTLRTAQPGASGRGRMYIPFTNAQIDQTTGLMATSPVTELCASFATFSRGLASNNGGVQVLSQKLGRLAPVTRVDADRIPDHQRSRQDKLLRTRVGSNV